MKFIISKVIKRNPDGRIQNRTAEKYDIRTANLPDTGTVLPGK